MIHAVMQLWDKGAMAGLNRRMRNLCNAIPFIATFQYSDGVETHIFFQLMDWQTKSDVVITNMTTSPANMRSQGFGSRAVQTFLVWAKENNLKEIQATQINNVDSRRFWEKNGFVRCADPNPCEDYVYKW